MDKSSGRIDAGKRVLPSGSSFLKRESLIPFSLLLFYLFLEYGRPQEYLRILRVLHLPAIVVILLAISMIVSENIRLKDKQTTLFLFLLSLMVLHGPIAVNNYWALIFFITMVSNFICFLALIRYVDTPDKFDRLIKYWIVIHVYLAIIGIMKQGKGIGGFFSDENDFCMTMNMIIPLSFFLAINASGMKRLYYALLTVLFLFVIILSQSRGGFVGLLAAFVYCWLRTKRKMMTAFIMGSLAVVAVLVAPPTYWNEVRSITEQGTSKGTGAERIYTWGVGWHMFLGNPVLGVGQGNFPYVFREYEILAGHGEEGYRGRSVAGRVAHSIYITMISELGLIGTCIILGMIINALNDLKSIRARSFQQNIVSNTTSKKNYFLALGLEGSLVAYLASGAFLAILYYPNVWLLMGFIVSLKRIVNLEPKPVST